MRKFSVVLVLVLTGLGFAADGPAICKGQEKCNELGRTKLLAAYQKALLAQQTAMQAQAAMNQSVETYNALAKTVAKEEGQPEGTAYQPDVAAGTVVAAAPPKKAEPAPEKK